MHNEEEWEGDWVAMPQTRRLVAQIKERIESIKTSMVEKARNGTLDDMRALAWRHEELRWFLAQVTMRRKKQEKPQEE